jgi:hypothetical protein
VKRVIALEGDVLTLTDRSGTIRIPQVPTADPLLLASACPGLNCSAPIRTELHRSARSCAPPH